MSVSVRDSSVLLLMVVDHGSSRHDAARSCEATLVFFGKSVWILTRALNPEMLSDVRAGERKACTGAIYTMITSYY